MLILFETPLGYALFKVDKSAFKKIKDWKDLPQSLPGVKKMLELQAFKEFHDAREVLQASVKMTHGKLSSSLVKFLQANLKGASDDQKLLVSDKKLANELSKKLNVKCESGDKVLELSRLIRGFSKELFPDLDQKEAKHMALGLAHGLGRFVVKFSADKVDTMIIQAVQLHGDLDKEINNYMMRLREWYGYHFPELAALIPDNLLYTKVTKAIGNRSSADKTDLSEFLSEDVAVAVKRASETSMGTEISETDENFILTLADQILELDAYRSNLEEYLRNRMMTVAPNLSMLIGEVVAARLIAKAGSLVDLAKLSASTIQIMGAEKALFKAMKTKKQTPKYGIIYQTKIISAANGRAKGKMARALASKAAICVRCDALAEDEDTTVGQESNDYLEKRARYLEEIEKKAENKKGGQSRGGYKQSPGAAVTQRGGGDFSMRKRENGSKDNSSGYKKRKE